MYRIQYGVRSTVHLPLHRCWMTYIVYRSNPGGVALQNRRLVGRET